MTGAALSGKKYKAYPEYKESGVEWVGEIPSDWSMWKLAHAFNEIGSGTTPPTNNEKWFKGDVPWITTGELREKIITDTKKKLSPSTLKAFPTLKKYPVGSIAIAMYGATIGRLGIFGVEAATNQACCVMTTSTQLNNKYLFYWLWAFKEDIIRLSSGGGQPNINQEKVASLRVSAPKSKEQQKIASFLDHETAKIDTLIAKQEKLIELLKEKRQAVISHAVTKGLNPNAPMRDSGVEWLGEVPEHWVVSSIKYLSSFVGTGGTPKNQSSFVDDNDAIKWFAPGDFSDKIELTQSSKYISFEAVASGDAKLYKENSVLVIGIGATLGKVALCKDEFSCNQQINMITPNKKTIAEFITFSLSAQHEQMKQLSNASTIGIMNQEKTKSIQIAQPPLAEQIEIVKYLNIALERFKLLESKATKQVDLLKERKTALISAAVTGKIDVRHFVAEQGQPQEFKVE
ncbi:restriction endonuclease subunit S [Pseudoalteromonas prydzensis]|uniref:restriction endonuclease subunit S n=1 Tax=Pseudoalteromonas prydzensis TaxID=182141 RepID=UPI003FD20774